MPDDQPQPKPPRLSLCLAGYYRSEEARERSARLDELIRKLTASASLRTVPHDHR
jgi:hypothetical protein